MNQHKYREQHLYQHKYTPSGSVNDACGTCSFCGAAIEADERFCPDCGSSRDGIRCPGCGTVSKRSFCSRCNTPLNDIAREAVRRAKADPAFQRAEQLAAELAELERQIENGGLPKAELDTSPNAEARQAASRYSSLFVGVASLKVPDAPAEAPSRPQGKVLTGNLLQAAIETYKAKARELQQAISSMLPPPSAPPEEQRNFFCARKIMTTEMRATRQEWVCNYCGCHHNQPSECAEPELGGTWIFVNQPTPVAKIIYG